MKNLSTFVRTSGNQFIAGKKFFTTSIAVFGSLADGGNSIGTSGQVLVSTGGGVVWADSSSVSTETLHTVTTRGNTTTNSITVGGLRVDDTTLYVDVVNNRVGIGTLTPLHKLQVEGGTFADYFQLDTTYSNGNVQGNISWDPDNNTALLGLDGDISLRIGQDDMWFVKNQTGATIAKGSVVYASGTLGSSGRILAAKMVADGSIAARYILGIAAEDIVNGGDGYVLAKGKIRQLDTSAFTEGSVLWVSPITAGALTATEPSAPNLKLPVAFVIKSDANGTLAVRVETGVRISDASDVQITSVANKNILRYNSTNSRWENVPGNTGYIDEGVNLYFTEQRARNSISAGTGISYNSGTGVITNSAPDQVVSLTGAGTTAITGTYPNFTITSNDQYVGTVTSVGVAAGTGISVAGSPITSSGTITITNTAPDQTVVLTGAGTTSISGTYPNFTITSNDQYVGTVTSVGLSVPTGFSVSGSPITSSGTLTIGFASGYSLPTDASQANWNTAYNTRIVSAAVSGTTTKTLTLTRGDSTTIQATWTDYDTAPVTSVNGQTGVVVLDTDDVAEGTSNLYFTTTRARSSVSAGTGISYNSTTGVITNSAPDQTVSITGAGTSVVTGTYPNFTVTTNDQYNGTVTSVGVAAGTGIAVSGSPITSSGTITVTNTAPDQVVGLSAGTGIQVTGTYPNFTITNTSPSSGGTLTGGGTINYVSKWSSATNLVDSQIFDNGTNVGIGTTSPNAYMSGTYGLSVYKNDYPGVGWANSSSYWLWYMYGSTFRMWNSSAGDVLTAQTNGNVGIGTTSPNSKLEVAGGIASTFGSTNGYIALRAGNSTVQGYIEWFKPNPTRVAYMGYNDGVSANNLGLTLENSANFVINGGNVGIGTTTPDQLLHINAGANTAYIRLVGQSRNLYIGQDTTGAVMYSDGNAPMAFFTSGTEKLRITASGNVGIGTTSPSLNSGGIGLNVVNSSYTQFRVQSTSSSAGIEFTPGPGGSTWEIQAGTSGQWFVYDRGLNQYRFLIDSSGNAVINDTIAYAKLDVRGQNVLLYRPSANASAIYSAANSTYSWQFGINDGADFIVTGGGFTGIGTERMRITSAGNVGIGTTAPEQKLHVEGTIQLGNVENLAWAYDNGSYYNYITNFYNTSNGMTFRAGSWTGGNNVDFSFQTHYGGSWSTKLAIKGDGNVGIGTTSPQGPLEIYNSNAGGLGGHIILNNNGTAVGNETAILFNDSGVGSTAGVRAAISSTVEGAPYLGDIKFKTGLGTYGALSTRMIITGAGNVGIGTTSPTGKLHISQNNSGGVAAILLSEDESTIQGPAANTQIRMGGNLVLGGSNIMTLGTNGSERIRITSAGNVGIGTTSPTARLSLGAASQGYRVTWDNYSNVFSEYSSGDLWLSSNFYGNLGSSGYVTSNTASFGAAGIAVSGTGGGLNGVIKFFVDNAASKTAGDPFTPSERMRITGGGNVGIGTTSPVERLHVVGSGAFNGSLTASGAYLNNANAFVWNQSPSGILRFGTNNTEKVRIDASGNVGIGTTAPSAKIQIFKSNASISYSDAHLRIDNDSSQSMIYFTNGAVEKGSIRVDSAGNFVLNSASRNFYFNNDFATFGTINLINTSTTFMSITSTGNVGIGTTSPSQKLHVDGSARVTGAYYDSSNSSGTSGQVLSSTGSGTQWIAAGSGSDAQNVLTSNAQGKDSTGFDFSGLLAEQVVMSGTNIRAYAPVTIDTNNSILAIVTFEVATYDFTDGKYAFQFYLESGGELNLSRHIFSQDMWALPDDSKGYTTFTYHMLISQTEGNALTLGDAVNLMVDDNYGMSPLIVFASLSLQKAYNY